MKTHPVIQLGAGNVGRELISRIIGSHRNRRFRHHALATSRWVAFGSGGLSDDLLTTLSGGSGSEGSQYPLGVTHTNIPLELLSKDLEGRDLSDWVVVDATASDETGDFLRMMAEQGACCVLANKKPLVGDASLFRILNNGRLGCRATVGTGLPVIVKIRELQSLKKQITGVEGCFSGTLGVLCTALENGIPFSQAVAEAYRLGFTEPDPREDLKGMDAARKILILARLSGTPANLDEVKNEWLFEPEMGHLSVDEFLRSVKKLDTGFRDRFERALDRRNTIRYVASFTPSGCRARLTEVPIDSPLGRLKDAGKLAMIHTSGENDEPVIVVGSGAGAGSTAEDLLKDMEEVTGDR